jgi:hypothetical protein
MVIFVLRMMFGMFFLKMVGRSVAEAPSSSVRMNAFGASLGNSS